MEEYVVNERHGFDHYDSLKDVTLIKIDRNGTHYYTAYKCPKCGGEGYINYYSHVDGGVTIKGTIKDHSEYKFVKQTELTRCKVFRV